VAYQFPRGYYWGVTQYFSDGLLGQQFELAVPFLSEPSP
jgi:hypothetical protein